ncbi:hypothetical protein HKX42_07880 [Salinisphaera sp. USBA-960]|nr:hypothetical protein [Salifodinibacter halophilus]NNC26790.1 hypothetical protein [Salifodinibacter halophilus]
MLNSIMAVLVQVLDLMRLRAGPQDMPGDRGSLAVAAALYVVAGTGQLLVLESLAQAVSLILLTTVLLAIYTAGLLLWRNVPNRFRQTATALFATGTLFTVIMIAPNLAMAPYLKAMRVNAANAPPTATQTTGSASSASPAQDTPDKTNANQSGNSSAGMATGAGEPLSASVAWAFLLFAAVGVWRLLVFGHIYRQALDMSRWMGVAAAIGFELFLLVVFAAV